MSEGQTDVLSPAAFIPEPQPEFGHSLAAAIQAHYSPSLAQLVPAHTLTRLALLTGHLPQALTAFWGFELPMNMAESSSDFLICLHQADVCHQVFQREPGLQAIIPEPLYSRLQALIRQWTDPADPTGQLISNIWLEYDYDRMQAGQFHPSFFYGPKGNVHSLAVLMTSQQIMTQLAPDGLPDGTYRMLARCMTMLAVRGGVSQIGRMLARAENSLRIFIQQIPTQGILPYLHRIAYPHADHPVLVAQLDCCYQFASTVDLDIDITSQVGGQLGLECYFATTEQALFFLVNLVNQGLCRADKYQLLHNHMQQLSDTADEQWVPFFSHVKLGFHPEKGFNSKVYLGYVTPDMAPFVIQTRPIATP